MTDRIEDRIVELLTQHKLTITTAESCTGGLIAGTLINVSGISDYYQEGYITYSNESKHRLLGVSEETLSRFGAVSKETAREMAIGAAKTANADVSVISTGVAGPAGGTKEKPVGLVYVGCFVKGNVVVEKHQFKGDRQSVREQSVHMALALCERSIHENYRG